MGEVRETKQRELRKRMEKHKRETGERRNQTGQRRYQRERRNNHIDDKQTAARSYKKGGENTREGEKSDEKEESEMEEIRRGKETLDKERKKPGGRMGKKSEGGEGKIGPR